MDMQWLDDVLVLLEERNMTRAAARRNITQPAFSRRIRSFEDWLGVEVLARGKNRIELSPALRSNEAEIRALVARIRDLRVKFTHHDPTRSVMSIAAQHAPVFSIFPDLALRAKQRFPDLTFRLRSANLRDCVSLFLRGDTNMMLCYEAEAIGPLSFGADVRRAVAGHDYLVPVVGGSLRYAIKDGGQISDMTPAIIYPEMSYFAEVLRKGSRKFGTATNSANPVCETALSSAIKELALAGIGLGWLPFSMAYREIENGSLISLAEALGREPLQAAIYANTKNEMSINLLEYWRTSQSSG